MARNKLKDVMWDYYTTNREITKEYKETYEKEKEEGGKRPWSRNEKIMAAVAVLAAVGIFVRLVVF